MKIIPGFDRTFKSWKTRMAIPNRELLPIYLKQSLSFPQLRSVNNMNHFGIPFFLEYILLQITKCLKFFKLNYIIPHLFKNAILAWNNLKLVWSTVYPAVLVCPLFKGFSWTLTPTAVGHSQDCYKSICGGNWLCFSDFGICFRIIWDEAWNWQ